MDREEIIQRFETLSLWRREGERAPHKPLLVLYAIGKLLRDGVRLIPYSEIDRNLERLLREFDPRRSNYGTHYPFWRLQNDGIRINQPERSKCAIEPPEPTDNRR